MFEGSLNESSIKKPSVLIRIGRMATDYLGKWSKICNNRLSSATTIAQSRSCSAPLGLLCVLDTFDLQKAERLQAEMCYSRSDWFQAFILL